MSARLARLALALYPLAYRRRYGTEIEALLEDSGASPAAVADLLRGAVAAHLRPEPAVATTVGREDRVRLGLASVLLCWVLFALAGLALYKTTEAHSLEGAAAPGMLGGLHLAIQVLAAVATAAVVLGAAPLVLAAVRQDGGRRAGRLALGCVATFAAASAALVVVANQGGGLSDAAGALVLGAWALVALACGVGCALAARRGLFAIAAPPRALAFARGCATVVAAAMVGIAALLLAYLVDLEAAAPGLADRVNGPLGNPDVALSLTLLLIAMVALVIPTSLSAIRIWRLPAPA